MRKQQILRSEQGEKSDDTLWERLDGEAQGKKGKEKV